MITQTTKKMTAKEQMIFDSGFESGYSYHKNKLFYLLECKNCNGRGNTDSLDGAHECNKCGGNGHMIEGLEDKTLEELLK